MSATSSTEASYARFTVLLTPLSIYFCHAACMSTWALGDILWASRKCGSIEKLLPTSNEVPPVGASVKTLRDTRVFCFHSSAFCFIMLAMDSATCKLFMDPYAMFARVSKSANPITPRPSRACVSLACRIPSRVYTSTDLTRSKNISARSTSSWNSAESKIPVRPTYLLKFKFPKLQTSLTCNHNSPHGDVD